MSEEEESELPKGTKVDVVAGKSSGKSGEIFWSGPNKYGPGVRYGVRDEDGEAHWVDAAHVVKSGGASVAPAEQPKEPKAPRAPAKYKKGDTVTVAAGSVSGEVFWVGDSKFGDGARYGVRDENGDTHWVDENELA